VTKGNKETIRNLNVEEGESVHAAVDAAVMPSYEKSWDII